MPNEVRYSYLKILITFRYILGLKFGEMEKDAMCSHGAAQFLKERSMENSDYYIAHVCDICGLQAHKVPKKNYYICKACNNSTRVSKVAMPYAFNLLSMELRAMNILMRMRTNNSIGS